MSFNATATKTSNRDVVNTRNLPKREIKRNLDALHHACDQTYKDLLGYACKKVESPEAAEDIVQQAFANTLAIVERGGEVRNMGGFLYRCVHNLCVNNARRRLLVSLGDEPYIEVENLAMELIETCPAVTAENKETWRQIEGVVDQMVPNQRNAFLLAEVRGYGYDEIAESMDRSTNSVRQLLSRARKKIRTISNAGSDWVGIPIPVLQANTAFAREHRFPGPDIFSQVQAKVSKAQVWLGNVFQGGAEATLQHSASVVAGAVVVALATAGPTPTIDQGPQVTEHVAAVTQEPSHMVTHPQSTAIDTQTETVTQAPAMELPRADGALESETGKQPNDDHGRSKLDEADDRNLSYTSSKSEDEEPEESEGEQSEAPDPVPQYDGDPPAGSDSEQCQEEGGGHNGMVPIECVDRDVSRIKDRAIRDATEGYESAGLPEGDDGYNGMRTGEDGEGDQAYDGNDQNPGGGDDSSEDGP